MLGLPFRQDQVPPGAPRLQSAPKGNHPRLALIGTAALIVLAGMGPAVAEQFDRAAAVDMNVKLPPLATGCTPQPALLSAGLDAPGRLFVQRFDCGEGPVTLTVEVFSPRSTASRLVSEQRRLVPGWGEEDAGTNLLTVPNTPQGAWQPSNQ